MTRALAVGLLLLLVIGWALSPALFEGRVLAFRDATHFYAPLYGLIAEEWSAGRVPLWNPYENLGQPLAGHPAAAVFYPGKLLWLLPVGHLTAYHWYIAGHLLLAAWAAYALARRWGAGHAASALAAISPYSGA